MQFDKRKQLKFVPLIEKTTEQVKSYEYLYRYRHES